MNCHQRFTVNVLNASTPASCSLSKLEGPRASLDTNLDLVPNAEPSLEGKKKSTILISIIYALIPGPLWTAIFALGTSIDATPNTLSMSERKNYDYTPISHSYSHSLAYFFLLSRQDSRSIMPLPMSVKSDSSSSSRSTLPLTHQLHSKNRNRRHENYTSRFVFRLDTAG